MDVHSSILKSVCTNRDKSFLSKNDVSRKITVSVDQWAKAIAASRNMRDN